MKIKITTEAYLKLKYFTELCDTEVSGLGKVKREDDSLLIYDIEVLEQTVSRVSSTLNIDSLANFLQNKLINNENISDYKVWWHSHVNMEARFSAIDDDTIDGSTEFPFLISIVINKKDLIEARFDLYKPIRLTFPVELSIILEENDEIKKQCEREVKEKVKQHRFWPQKDSNKILISEDKKRFSTPKFFKKQSQ